MINLELYKIFATVAEESNITRASEKLNLTQPAVTKHIKNLENLLQIKLFVRSNHGIVLTKSGQNLYDEIIESIDLLTKIEQKYYKTRKINLGIHSTLLNRIFGTCISEFYAENSSGNISTKNLANKQMIQELKNKELDLIFSKEMDHTELSNSIRFTKLGEFHDILIVKNNSMLKDKIVTIEDLKNNIIYMPRKSSETCRNFFESTHTINTDFKEIRNITYSTIVEVVKNSDAIGLVTKEFVFQDIIDKDLCILNTNFKIKPIEFGIYTNKDNIFEDLKKFIKIIKKYFLSN